MKAITWLASVTVGVAALTSSAFATTPAGWSTDLDKAFEKAKASGKVSGDVVRTLRKALDNDTMREALRPLESSTGFIDYTKIPTAWSKNIFNKY